MFLSLIRKQIKILLRSPSEILILLVMPIVLICILSFALGSLMNGDSEMSIVEIAVIQHEDEESQLQNFVSQTKDTMPLDDQNIENLKQMLPVSMLLEQLMNNEELQEMIHVTQLGASKLEDIKNSGDYSVILEIPEGFTIDYLKSIFLDGEKPTFNVYMKESDQITSTIVKNFLDYYQDQYTLFTLLGQSGLLLDELSLPSSEITSKIRTVDSQEGISSSVYYTFSMTVMFILYVASTIASQAFIEKQMHIFDRILLARIQPFTYLSSIMVSTVILAITQVVVLFTISHFIFDISFDNWQLYLLLTTILAIVVGAIAALLSSINYRYNSAEASNIFSSAFVSILAFFGGSYFNVSSISPVLANIGIWTPNGAALDGYLTIAQNGTLSDLLPNLMNLSILAVIIVVFAFLLFPKRGGIV